MARRIVSRAAATPLAGLVLAACVSQSAYNEQASQLEHAQVQAAAKQAEIAKMQAENRWGMAGDDPNILSAKGFGDTHPVAPNDTPQGRAQNRRIEIVLEG